MAGSSGAIRAGGAFVELFVNAANVQKGLNDAQAKVQNFGSSIAGIGAKLATLGGSIAAPMLGAAKLFADSGSELLLMSERTGMSVEALSTLKYVAKQTGTDLESVEVGVKKMEKAMTAGTEENMAAVESFAMLNLSISKLMQLSPDERFQAVAKSLARVKDPAIQAGLAMQIMGRSGTALLPLVKNMDELSAEAEQFGLVTSQEAAENAYKLQKAFNLLTSVVSKIVTTVGAALAPTLIEWGRYLAEGAVVVRDWIKAHQPMVVMAFKIGFTIAKVGAVLVTVGGAIAGLGTVFGVFSSTLSAIAAGFALLISPLGLITAGFIGMTTYMVKTGQAGTGAFTSMKDALGGLLAEVKTTFGGIADALKAGDIMLAGQILWAGLKVEFQKGLNYLRGLWVDWGGAVLEVFTNVKFAIAKVFINLGPNISKDFITVTGALNDAFVWVVGQMKSAWVTFTNFLSEAFDKALATVLPSLIGVIAEIKRQIAIFSGWYTLGQVGGAEAVASINKEETQAQEDLKTKLEKGKADRAKAQQDAETAPGREIAANQEGRKKRIAGIEAGRVGALATSEEDRKTEIEARRKAAQDAMASGQGDLTKAQKELADLNYNAKVASAAGMKPVLATKAPQDLSSLGFNRGFQQMNAEVKGSFSAGALGGLGAGETVQDQQLKEMKQSNANLQAIGRKIDRSKPVFS